MTGVLAWFFKITKIAPFESVLVFRKGSALGPVLSSLFINDLPASLSSSVSCSLYTDDLAIWSSSPSVPTTVEATQGALIRLERWSEYWCLPLDPSKCEASFFSVDLHQANLQPHVFLSNSRLRFNPTPTFLGVTFDRILFFSKHVSSLKAKFLPCLKALCCIFSSWGPFLFCINFFFVLFSHTFYPDGSLFLALPRLPNCNAFTERLVAPSPAVSRPPLSHFSSLSLLHLPYESL